jgi:hypothetical protein
MNNIYIKMVPIPASNTQIGQQMSVTATSGGGGVVSTSQNTQTSGGVQNTGANSITYNNLSSLYISSLTIRSYYLGEVRL